LAEHKIPVLTEVYKPKVRVKPVSGAVDISEDADDFVSKVTANIKSGLVAEITDCVLDELKAEIKKAQSEVIASTQSFVDKTKADLKTEIPKMYQDSVRLGQVDIDALKKATSDEVLALIRNEMVDLKERVVREHQQQINETLASIAKQAVESASEQIAAMHNKIDSLQLEAFAKLTQDFNAEKETMLKAATTEIEARFSNEMTKEQQHLHANIEAVLTKVLPEMESHLQAQLQKELQQLLVKVKFVLPE
jgi:hypothetical protein